MEGFLGYKFLEGSALDIKIKHVQRSKDVEMFLRTICPEELTLNRNSSGSY